MCIRDSLPVGRERENYFENIFINDNDLPDVIVEEYKNDKTNYLTLNDDTDVDWTITTYGDKIYNGIMDEVKLMGYYDNDNNTKLCVNNKDACYKSIRDIYI